MSCCGIRRFPVMAMDSCDNEYSELRKPSDFVGFALPYDLYCLPFIVLLGRLV
jgi:hypothetical protein